MSSSHEPIPGRGADLEQVRAERRKTSVSRLSRVRGRLSLPTLRRAAGLLDGRHQSVFVGHGQDFDDLSVYRPGDDVKDIDWKASARTGQPIIKRYQRESNLPLVLAVDTGLTMAAHAPSGEDKRDLAIVVAEVMAYLARMRGDSVAVIAGDAQRLVNALEAVGLQAHANKGPEELSGGEQQRLMIARTLAYDPDLYVLDEPFVGLDAVVKDNLMQLLRDRAEAGSAIMVSSHELDILDNDMHTLTLLDQGKTIFDGTKHDFVSRFVPEDTVAFTLAEPVDAHVLNHLNHYRCSANGTVLKVSITANDPVGELVATVATHAHVVDMVRSPATLNDAIRNAYEHLTHNAGTSS